MKDQLLESIFLSEHLAQLNWEAALWADQDSHWDSVKAAVT
jgi:hypothetical protein